MKSNPKRPQVRRAPASSGSASPSGKPPGATVPREVGGRRWAFRVGALATPLLVVILLELVLRLAHYGYPTSFFLPAQIQGRAVFVENDKFAWRFFPPEIARSPSPIVVDQAKAPGTYRILLFGESAALGDPRPAYGVGRYLEVLLRERFPKARFEVVPVAMTAINSHGLLPMARECARLDGDFWLVYMGNNEMEGPFGAANPFGPRAPKLATVRAVLALKTTRIGQLVSAVSGRFANPRGAARGWTGMKMMTEHPIPPLDPAKETIYRNFQRNLEDIVELGLGAKATILLSSVACNLRECAPFASVVDDRLNPAQRARWTELRLAAHSAQTNHEYARAADLFQQAVAIDGISAELAFRLGHCWLALTNSERAGAQLGLARDHDALPFRADSRLNGIIKDVAVRNAGRGVGHFDAGTILATNAPGGCAGSEVFFEHVHLNFDGNYQLALGFAAQLAQRLPAAAQVDRRPDWASAELCARRLGLTDWNRFAVYENVLQRIQDAPFTNQLDHPMRVRGLQTTLAQLKATLQPQNYMDARALYEEAIVRSPKDFRLHENFAEYLESIGELAEARQHWAQVRDLIPHTCLPYYHLARMQVRTGQSLAAVTNLVQALALRPDFTEARLELGQAYVRAGKPDQGMVEYETVLRRQPENATVYLRIADLLAAQNKRPEAMAKLREAIRLRPEFWEARYLLGVELVMQEQIQEAGAQFAEVVRLRPDYAPGHLNYGVALAKSGHLGEAVPHFRETLRLDPANAKAAEYLRTIESAAKRSSPTSN